MKGYCIAIALFCTALWCTGSLAAGGDAGETEPAAVEEAAAITPPGAPSAGETMAQPAESYMSQAGRKLKRSCTNIGRSATEFYVQPMEAKRNSGKSISMAWPGMGEAFGMFMTRLFGGVIELVTCPVPFPNGWQPLLDE